MTPSELGSILIPLAAIGGVVIGWAFGVLATRQRLKPCELCGTTTSTRSSWGLSETWCCDDKDGCAARGAR